MFRKPDVFAMYDRKGWPFGCPFFFDSSRCDKGSELVIGCMVIWLCALGVRELCALVVGLCVWVWESDSFIIVYIRLFNE